MYYRMIDSYKVWSCLCTLVYCSIWASSYRAKSNRMCYTEFNVVFFICSWPNGSMYTFLLNFRALGNKWKIILKKTINIKTVEVIFWDYFHQKWKLLRTNTQITSMRAIFNLRMCTLTKYIENVCEYIFARISSLSLFLVKLDPGWFHSTMYMDVITRTQTHWWTNKHAYSLYMSCYLLAI